MVLSKKTLKIKEMVKENLFKFIKENLLVGGKDIMIERVDKYRINDGDDEAGFAGEHFVVECILRRIDPHYPIKTYGGEIKRTCLVHRPTFRLWVQKLNAVIWLD
jgi:hypothetical protein